MTYYFGGKDILELNKIYCGDCLELMRQMPDKSINLIVIDPPYNIGKAKWDKIKNYIEWMGKVFTECQRLLKDNGSFYFFHNDFLQIVDLQKWINQNTEFVFKQLIVWNKRFVGARNKGFLDGFVETGGLRNYQQMAEYCLFYTFQDETGLNKVLAQDGFYELQNYFMAERKAIGWNYKQCDDYLGIKASYCYWDKSTTHPYRIPEKQHYEKLQLTGKWQKPYEDLRREYEGLRREYEGLRYTYNNQKTHHSVWNYEVAPKVGHITPKPVELIENIIKHSSNPGDIVFDCFIGSGTTAVACISTNRFFIGIEKSQEYCDIANKRIEALGVNQQLMI